MLQNCKWNEMYLKTICFQRRKERKICKIILINSNSSSDSVHYTEAVLLLQKDLFSPKLTLIFFLLYNRVIAKPTSPTTKITCVL